MNIIAVDDEQPILNLLSNAICKAAPEEKSMCFSLAEEALCYAEQHPVDVAFLDVEMGGMTGIELAKKLIALHPKVNIIFVTGHEKYMADAFRLHASGYVRKPVRLQRVQKELSNLRYPIKNKNERFYRIGSFEIDHQSLRVTCNGNDLLLMPREYALFQLLAENPGVIFTMDELYKQAWGQETSGDFRTVYSHMHRLRKKLNLDENIEIDIEQQRGKGYCLKILHI